MSKQTIWNYLKSHTDLPDVSIAGIMGNMESESNCEACRVQGDFTNDRSTSIAYAKAVNTGEKSEAQFCKDALGWGLCQWTYWSRKQNLLNSCRSQGKGIGDEEAQLAFMLAEMQMEFTNMWRRLLVCTSITDAAGLVCREYERPAVLNITDRAKYGQQIYNTYHGTTPEPTPEPMGRDAIIDAIYELLEKLR